MDERTSLSRRKLLHALAGTGVIAAADLAWWDAPYIGPRKAWGAEPVRFQWSVPEPTRIALMNSLAERFNQSQKDFAVRSNTCRRRRPVKNSSARPPAE